MISFDDLWSEMRAIDSRNMKGELPIVVYDSYQHGGTGTREIELISIHAGQLWLNLAPQETTDGD